MENYIFDHDNGLWYELQGVYYIPCLVPDEADSQPIGIWGRRYLCYIREHRPALYSGLLLSGKLNNHVSEIDRHASEMFDQLVKQLAERGGITEQLKAQNQMACVQRMNSVQNTAEEIVLNEFA